MIDEIIEKYRFLSIEDFGMSSQADDAVLIIEKSGIDKLESNLGIQVEAHTHSLTPYNYVGKKGPEVGMAASIMVSAFILGDESPSREIYEVGSAHHMNTNYNYELEIAFKRARARAILRISKIQETFPLISRDEYFEKIKSKSNMDMISSQLSTPMDQQDIDRAEEARQQIKAKLEEKERERSEGKRSI